MGQKKKLRILSPIDRFIEAEALIAAGATELYGGMFPSWFADYPYFLSPNQRTFKEAQMDENEFSRVVKICLKNNVPLYMTINNLYFTEEQLPLIVKMAKQAEQLGVKAFIMGSLPLVLNILEANINIPIHLSTMAVTLNHFAVSFWGDLGINRFTLPRSLTTSEIKSITTNNPQFEYDAFILVGKCPNVEGFCSFLHTNPKKIWPCEQYYEIKIMGEATNNAPNISEIQKRWQGFYRGHGCGICAITKLIDAGITGLKIVGRGSPLSFKLQNLKLIFDAIDTHNTYENEQVIVQKLKELYVERFGHVCSPYECYFPEMW